MQRNSKDVPQDADLQIDQKLRADYKDIKPYHDQIGERFSKSENESDLAKNISYIKEETISLFTRSDGARGFEAAIDSARFEAQATHPKVFHSA